MHVRPPLLSPPRVFRVPELNYDPMTSICDALNDTAPADWFAPATLAAGGL